LYEYAIDTWGEGGGHLPTLQGSQAIQSNNSHSLDFENFANLKSNALSN